MPFLAAALANEASCWPAGLAALPDPDTGTLASAPRFENFGPCRPLSPSVLEGAGRLALLVAPAYDGSVVGPTPSFGAAIALTGLTGYRS
jgi:hypothetical protein